MGILLRQLYSRNYCIVSGRRPLTSFTSLFFTSPKNPYPTTHPFSKALTVACYEYENPPPPSPPQSHTLHSRVPFPSSISFPFRTPQPPKPVKKGSYLFPFPFTLPSSPSSAQVRNVTYPVPSLYSLILSSPPTGKPQQ